MNFNKEEFGVIKMLRQEDCNHFNVQMAYDMIKNNNLPAFFNKNYVIVGTQDFLEVASHTIGPLHENNLTTRMMIESQFRILCAEFLNSYSSVMLILKIDKDGKTNG